MKNLQQPVLAAMLLAATPVLAQTPDDHGSGPILEPPVVTPEDLTADTGPAGTPARARRTPIHTAPDDMGSEYGIWATGRDYKASFHAGMNFVPYLGADYPTTQSIGWTTKSVKLGGTELLGHATDQRARGSWRYEYEFGVVTEAYDVLEAGLEQTFVLHAKPATGDLVIRGALATGLRSRDAAPAHQALTFCDLEGRELVHYGAAIAFDANGARVDVTTAYADGEVTLTVPGQWMEQALLPITVDPLIAPTQIASGSAPIRNLDIGRDDASNEDPMLFTYTRAVSAQDADLWTLMYDEHYALGGITFVDVTSSWSTDQTSCAFVGGADRWAIVFRRHFVNATTRTSRLRCHVHDSGDTTLGTSTGQLNPTLGFNDWRPDVGGSEAFVLGDHAMVVFQREDNLATNSHFSNASHSQIYGCLLDLTTANGTFGTPFAIKPSTVHDNERPSINQVARGGSSFSWACVFQRFHEGSSNEDWDLIGTRIDNNGNVASGTWHSDLSNATPKQHQLGPKVEGQNGRYAVVFSTVDVASVNFKTSLIRGKKLCVERFDWEHADNGPSGNFQSYDIRSTIDRQWEACDIGFDTRTDSHWVCLFRSVPPGAGYLYYSRLGYNGVATEGFSGIPVYATNGDQVQGAGCVYDNDNESFSIGYAVEEAGNTNPVFGTDLTYDQATTQSTFGVSCGSANILWSGSQQIGSEFSSVRVQGAPPGAIHVMLAATATTNVPVIHPIVFPGCQLFVMAAGPGYLGAFPTAVGSSFNFQLPLPEYLTAQDLHFQDWYLTGNGLLYSTSRLTVPIIK